MSECWFRARESWWGAVPTADYLALEGGTALHQLSLKKHSDIPSLNNRYKYIVTCNMVKKLKAVFC